MRRAKLLVRPHRSGRCGARSCHGPCRGRRQLRPYRHPARLRQLCAVIELADRFHRHDHRNLHRVRSGGRSDLRNHQSDGSRRAVGPQPYRWRAAIALPALSRPGTERSLGKWRCRRGIDFRRRWPHHPVPASLHRLRTRPGAAVRRTSRSLRRPNHGNSELLTRGDASTSTRRGRSCRCARAATMTGNRDRTYTEKYLACGWWTTMAEVDCSGSSWSSSVRTMSISAARSSSSNCFWSARLGQAG